MSRATSDRERAFCGDDVEIVTPTTQDELADVLRAAEADGRTVVPAGLGAHAGSARCASGALLVSTAALDGIEVYEPDDFTIGVQAGMPLARMRDELRAQGQELPVDLGASALGTAGGLVARAPIGPRQHRNGALTALLLGAEGMRGAGDPFRSGGMVVKNVAGYQVHKLLVGAWGRAGVVTRVNFRLRPLPERRAIAFAAGEASTVEAAVSALTASKLEPVVWLLQGDAPARLRAAGLPLPDGPVAAGWLFEGSDPRVRWQADEATRVVRENGLEPGDAGGADESEQAIDAMVELGDPSGVPLDEGAVRISVLPADAAPVAAEVLERAAADGVTLAVTADPFTGNVQVRWQVDDEGRVAEPLAALGAVATAAGGRARILYLPPEARRGSPQLVTVDPNAELAKRILRVFDPAGTFAPPPEDPS